MTLSEKKQQKKTKASYFLNKIVESQQKTVPAVDLMQIALCWLNSIRIVEKRVLGFPCNFGVMFTHAYSANNNNKSNIYIFIQYTSITTKKLSMLVLFKAIHIVSSCARVFSF